MVREALSLPALRLGTIHSLLVGVSFGTPELSEYEKQEQFQAEFLARLGTKCSTFWVIKRVTSPGDAAIREKARQMAERFRTQVRGSAVAITATGLGAVFARGFMGAFALVTNPDPPMRTFRSIADGVAWLRELPGQDPAVIGDAKLVEDIEAFAAGAGGL